MLRLYELIATSLPKPMNSRNQFVLKEQDDLFWCETPAISNLAWLKHAFLTRRGGVSLPPYESLNVSANYGDRKEDALRNRIRIATAFGFPPDRLILLDQVHGNEIFFLTQSQESFSPPLEYDAMITSLPNRFLGILTADCIPILMIDPEKRAIAAVHAGRQGTALRISAEVIRRMGKEFGCNPRDLLVALGPSIGICCYEIDERAFLPEWIPFATRTGEGKWMLNLGAINRNHVEKEGVKKENIFSVDLCTRCRDDLFFSYRREKKGGRQLSFIGMI